jgi:hypothetical protein
MAVSIVCHVRMIRCSRLNGEERTIRIGVTESRDRFKSIDHLTVRDRENTDILSNAGRCHNKQN